MGLPHVVFFEAVWRNIHGTGNQNFLKAIALLFGPGRKDRYCNASIRIAVRGASISSSPESHKHANHCDEAARNIEYFRTNRARVD